MIGDLSSDDQRLPQPTEPELRAFRRDVPLDRFDIANLLGALRNLEDIAHDVGIRRVEVTIQGVDYESAVKFDPDANRVHFDVNDQTSAFTSHVSRFGDELVVSFLTGRSS